MSDMGRPSKYTEELAGEILERMCEGESLRQICRDENMPHRSTVFRWLSEKPDFQDHYARAGEERAAAMFDEILDIADDGSNDWMQRELDNGQIVEVPNHEHISRSKLRVDARKWALSKMAPKKYGDKLELGGPDGQAIVPVINLAVGNQSESS